ncbi:MAG: hypothetical protein Q7Q73_05615 [Verrucomicrobiota bacterium JB024]|nr:hypothetical protein [Verrucomicrobiota bacterium JB024]
MLTSPLTIQRRQHGFALIVALSLMAFIVLLLVSLSSLVRVDMAASSNNANMTLAREYARFSAFKALGQLQKSAGPDQRVTARADILLAPGVDPLEGQAHWLGVWSTENDLTPAQRQDVTWLVSGQNPDAYVAAPDRVQLVSSAHTVLTQEDEVWVSSEPVTLPGASHSGIIAYWITDESLKARVNIEDPYLGDALGDSPAYDAQMAQLADPTVAHDSEGYRVFYPVGGTDTAEWKSGPSNLTVRLKGISDLDYLVDGQNRVPSRGYYHDLTFHSYSVLSDTKDGGLKRDLSSLLLNVPADLRNTNDGSIFAPALSGRRADPGGPKWTQLADYYQFSLGDNTGAVNMRVPTNDTAGFAPVVTRCNLVVQLFAQLLPTAPVEPSERRAIDYTYTIGYFPLITLWNPYDHDMVIPDLGFELDGRPVYIAYEYEDITDPLNPVTRKAQLYIVEREDADIYPHSDGRRKIPMTIQGTTIPAGRAINFTPPVNSYMASAPPDGSKNVLKPGASAELVRGFFLEPVVFPKAGSGSAAREKAFLESKTIDELAIRAINPGKYTVQLYADNSFSTSRWPNDPNRFLAISAPAPGLYDCSQAGGMKVITPDMLGLLDFTSNIEPAGRSVSADYMDDSVFVLSDFNDVSITGQNFIYGAAIRMNFPQSRQNGDYYERSHLFTQMNVRTPISSNQVHSFNASDNGTDNYMYQLYNGGNLLYEKTGDPLDDFITGADDLYAPVGFSNDHINGSQRMVLFEVPQTAPLGIGQFMHAPLMRVDVTSNLLSLSPIQFESNKQQSNSTPTYAIGNSLANIHLPLGWTKMNFAQSDAGTAFDGSYYLGAGWQGSQYDYSYELNDALWDGYFLSTILPDNRERVSFPLPNARMTRVRNARDVDLIDEQRASANLLLEGGFNINSTSVAAWESILGAMRDVDTMGGDPDSVELRNNFSRFLAPMLDSAPEAPRYGDHTDELLGGFRSLSDEQVSALAVQIVDEIKRRSAHFGYPFGSLSAFINRSIDTSVVDSADPCIQRFAYEGPLQFAIDQSSINGTPAINADGEAQRGVADGLWTPAGGGVDYIESDEPGDGGDVSPYRAESVAAVANRPYAEGIPGYLTQADVLAKIGPAITARGDTFTIRAYGAVHDDLSGATQAEAYCEMVVQRVPEYVDSASDAPYEAPTSAINQEFGRRFEIISFRWLNNDSI